jgi:hypothetical protein
MPEEYFTAYKNPKKKKHTGDPACCPKRMDEKGISTDDLV